MDNKPKIAIVGAGLMGHGIAQIFAAEGHPVAIHDPSGQVLAAVPQRVEAIMRALDIDVSLASGIVLHDHLANAVEGAALVIEAAPEKLALKQSIFEELDRLAGPETILASNTSVIPITDIAAKATNKARILGTHFWNPPHYVPLVEVIQTADTDPAHIDWTLDMMTSVGMSAVHVKKDVAGFIGNRLQHALKREAIALVADGVCDAATLDKVVREGFGARLGVLGPLEQSDMIGLQLTLDCHEVLLPHLDNTPGAHPFLREKIAKGETGMAAGKGFRAWTEEEADEVRHRFQDYMAACARKRRDEKSNACQNARASAR
jgi:3-hydroxybutyryl-CoA dehydrogenase